MALSTGLHFTLTLPGVDDVAVIDFTHREALSQPFELALNLASRDGSLDAADLLDREASLTIWQDGQPLRTIHGIVSEFGRGDRGHRRTFYTLVLRPALWRLSLRQNSRIFQQVDPLTIINTLCDERGITDVRFAVTREPENREYCVQYRETDLAFIERLAAEEGLFYFHEFDENSHHLVFADDPSVLTSVGERPYHSRAGGTAPQRHVRKLRHTARVATASATLKDYSFKTPAYAQLHEHQGRDVEAHGQRDDYEHYDYPGRYKQDASGKPFSRICLEQLRRDTLTADADSDLPELAPGVRLTLTDHDTDTLNRDWQAIDVVHYGEQPQALEEDGVLLGGESQGDANGMTRYYNQVTLIPGDAPWRATANPKPRVDGPQVAFVVGPEGEEIHCDEHGRVKVQFPWDRYAEPNDTASCWVRVAQGWAGGGYGSIAIPRIGHEVIVSFLEGDPDQPLVTGRTYHAVNTAPYPLPEHKTRTVLRTQSHKADGFNELRFEDEAGEEQIWLHAQKDLELLTLNDRTEEIRNDSHLKVHNDRISEIDNDDHHTVHHNRHTQVDGDDHLIIDGTRHEKVGQAQLMEAGREVHQVSGGKTVIDAGAEITLKAGGSFVKLDPSGITIVGAKVNINSGGSPGIGSGQAATTALLPGEKSGLGDKLLDMATSSLFASLGEQLLDMADSSLLDGLADFCSACQPSVGNPVNPVLGAKLLPAETDFALPAPKPFVFTRGYLSRNAQVGVLGQGWSVPGASLTLSVSDQYCALKDAQGRTIRFGALAPGQERFSPTEQLWLRRGGMTDAGASQVWQALDEATRFDDNIITLYDGAHYLLFIADDTGTWQFTQERDRNGYATTYHWEGDLLVRVEDSAGRHYQWEYELVTAATV